jgi:hypothetical protein
MLTASHTHSSPVVNRNLFDIYPPFDDEMKKKVEENLKFLEDRIVQCAGQALNNLKPARVSTGVGIARFAVNRRNNKESEVLNTSDLAGPYDHTVPVIKVSDAALNPVAVIFGYACHATTLWGNHYSGDYPGYAQVELEKSFPGITALFFAGCGGDQNGIPRGTVPLAEQYGNELAEAVKRVLKEPMSEQEPKLSTLYNEIELPFSDPLSIDELTHIIENSHPYQQRWARKLIQKLNSGETIPENYLCYPAQTWQLGNQILIALGGEVVVDYAHKLKNKWGNDLFIAAYANDVMAYIPSERVLKEGGYEGDFSMRAYGQPATWAPGVEKLILSEVDRQIKTLKNTGKDDKD